MFKSAIKDILQNVDFDSLEDSKAKEEFDLLLADCKKFIKNGNQELLKKAFLITLDANKDRLRLSGTPYYKHAIAVARIVATEIKLDDVSVIAALLCDVIKEENEYDYKLIKSEFGTTIADIVTGIEKINHIEEELIQPEVELENYRKLLMSMFKDVRIIFIKLAERLENLRTIAPLDKEKQLKDAKEALEVFAPFANRFGFRNIKWELEDLAFKITNREEFDNIKTKLLGKRKDREKYVEDFKAPLLEKISNDKFLEKNNVKVKIYGRAKHIYSIYNKTIARNKPVDELYDLIAIRIILDCDDPNMCFYVYSLAASIYPPVPETFKDYINAPKQNGYQSIHCAVLGPQRRPVEIQLRTQSMHEVAERGIAAHFNYKKGFIPAQSVFDNPNAIEWMDSVREMIENNGSESPEELFNFLKKNTFLQEIHVFTPKNELYTFPINSTPLDFAFQIHSELGSHYIGAKVNGKIVPIDYKLQSGDQVEILTSNKKSISEDWQSIITTNKARSVLDRHLKERRTKNYRKGRKLWKSEIINQKLAIRQSLIDKVVNELDLASERDMYIELGKGNLNTEYIKQLLDELSRKGSKPIVQKPIKVTTRTIIKSLIIRGKDRPGIVKEITENIVTFENVSLKGISFDTIESIFEGKVTLKMGNDVELKNIIANVMKINDVESVEIY
ncbi:MAG: bifunctional (p)ppGpp synthetase/guanosine-3',5'-bis(diphosphate) 3'-pyrophosphohydrolase [Ignavibacteriae bacterium]|nr:bifunctional (p)ppGpp synthetase/guanosine-3',5'-bis(diphosphate) 3'-pyrophosphohydrolase [Ignavibacteriota bacterium]MCB9222419.1 bifunctional (p)ppGpp synthetase/guanosine-3',5'-bis(diphosphate) 3'-pyrophosphohydrolase [Ignavibacteria bacterium]